VIDPDAAPDAAPDTGPTTGHTLLQRLLAEAVGTFVVVLVGCGAWAYATTTRSFAVLSVALAFGLAYALVVHTLGRVSGAHVNPAVSVAAAAAGRMSWRDAASYAGAQVVGAIAAALVLLVLLQGYGRFDLGRDGLGQTYFGDEGTGYAWWAAFLLELVLTAVLVLVVLGATDRRSAQPATTPLVVGATVVALHLVALPATGASFNPARSLGPALFAGVDALAQVWLFLLAPLLGALAAGLLHPLVLGRADEPVPGSGLQLRLPARRPAAADPATSPYQEQWDEQLRTGQPIIQDGWQWDPHAQQWIPAPDTSDDQRS